MDAPTMPEQRLEDLSEAELIRLIEELETARDRAEQLLWARWRCSWIRSNDQSHYPRAPRE